MKLSVIIIAKNAEVDIADAIGSTKDIASEVIVVDNGSQDRTIEIVKYLKARVVEVEEKDFSILRNAGLKEAKGEWILYIDADERVTDPLAQEINLAISNSQQAISVFKINRKNFYFGKHEWPYVEQLERLFRRLALKGWKGQLHESPIIEGETRWMRGFLLHYTHKDLSSMIEKTLEWSKIEADLRFQAGHPRMVWWRFLRVMTTAFVDSYIKQRGWKAGTVGLIESIYQAFSIFITYARLWELQQKNKT